MLIKGKNRLFLYTVACLRALSSAGAVMTLLSLSTSFLAESDKGFASSAIYGISYLGLGVVGLFGGPILQKYGVIQVGIFGSMLNALILFVLAGLDHIPVSIGLPAVLLTCVLGGIEHPNNMRFFNRVLLENEKLQFFSFMEFISCLLSLIAPLIAAYLIYAHGTRTCFLIDGITYLISSIPWFLFRNRFKDNEPQTSFQWALGFKAILEIKSIRQLNLSRILNNITYVMWTAMVPLLIARVTLGGQAAFAKYQGAANSILSAGFIVASLLGTFLARSGGVLVPMVLFASFGGVLAIFLLLGYLSMPLFLYLSAFVIGMGTYCFRVSGMTLGQAFTPIESLGSVIVAGDAIIRLWSFCVALIPVWIFKCDAKFHFSLPVLCVLLTLLPLLTLFAPAFTLGLARSLKR